MKRRRVQVHGWVGTKERGRASSSASSNYQYQRNGSSSQLLDRKECAVPGTMMRMQDNGRAGSVGGGGGRTNEGCGVTCAARNAVAARVDRRKALSKNARNRVETLVEAPRAARLIWESHASAMACRPSKRPCSGASLIGSS